MTSSSTSSEQPEVADENLPACRRQAATQLVAACRNIETLMTGALQQKMNTTATRQCREAQALACLIRSRLEEWLR